jgi:LysM repeat protein
VEATARANATEAAQTTAAQTPEQEEPTEAPTEPPATATPLPTATPESATAAPTAAPTATSAPPSSGPTAYVVQPDDNLFRIALRFNTTVEAIAEANGIANPRLIRVGQTLTIPAGGGQQPPASGTTYVVQPGDNLFRIALRYNMSHRRLAEYNGITNPSNIYVGQVIQIPSQ